MRRIEVTAAVLAFTVLCAAVLSVTPQSAEPDDGAYHASIVAVTEGHFLTLSLAQAEALAGRLRDNPAAPPNQWVEVSRGRYISEKDPGYPYLAAPFQELGVIRLAPLFYGALACIGLFAGARRWLGRFGGPLAVGLYCSSGAALAFAWRDYMPTFTDASLVAAGTGTLLWSLLATDVAPRRRTAAGFAAFAAIELATFARYTDITFLACAVLAVVATWRLPVAKVSSRMVCWWVGSAAAFAIAVAVFNDAVYGGPLTSGYPPGEVNFAVSAIGPNLRFVPRQLIEAMPVAVLALAALIGIVIRWATHKQAPALRRDLAVGVALAASWLAIWALYLTYTWTADDATEVTVQVIRFYVPALGAIALLGAWLVTRIPGRTRAGAASVAAVVVLFGLGVWAFHAMYAAFGVPLHG